MAHLLVVSLAVALGTSAFAAAGGRGGDSRNAVRDGQGRSSSERAARAHYERGLAHRDRALAYEERAGASDESDREWRRAVAAYEAAIDEMPRFHEAYSDLGFAHRKRGDTTRSLVAYERALEIQPNYAPAIEYRGEAYLTLARLADAQRAYTRLLALDRPLADQLLERMGQWLADVGAGPPEGLAPERLEAFRRWVEERQQVASRAGPTTSRLRTY